MFSQYNYGWFLYFQILSRPSHPQCQKASRVAEHFLSEEVPEMIDWPSNSLSLNPVVNVWSIIKRRVEKRKPINHQELNMFQHEEWDKTARVVLSHWVDSMESRCLALIELKGGRIIYQM